MYIPRYSEKIIKDLLQQYPVVAILGPRQCGKSTLAQYILNEIEKSVYIDLELPSDIRKLDNSEQFLSFNSESLICIDEIQKKPELFPVIRALSDKKASPGQYLILGSSSPDLLKQSSESLAGRISYLYLTPFHLMEIDYNNIINHWFRGGFPGSWLAKTDKNSSRWLNDFILTYLERDIPNLGLQINTNNIHRLWTMLAHSTGQITNKVKLGESLGISSPTVQNYMDILDKTFMIRILYPYHTNLKKRLIKSPKIYIRDTGILHLLLEINSINSLMGHINYGQSWEAYAMEQIISYLPDAYSDNLCMHSEKHLHVQFVS